MAGGGLDEPGAGWMGGMQILGRLPQVLKHVDEIHDDVDVDTAALRFLLQAVQLVVGPVDQHDPAATVLRVAGLSLVEQGGDHRRDGVFQRRVHGAAGGAGAGPAGDAFGRGGGQDVRGAAGCGCRVVDRGHHRHAGTPGAVAARQLR